MPVYLLLAYAIFCAGPLGLALAIAIRRRRIRRLMAKIPGVSSKIVGNPKSKVESQ